MSPEELAQEIANDAARYTTGVTGSFFHFKDAQYDPWVPYAGSEQRYNGPGTGSIYLAQSTEECFREVGTAEGKRAYRVDVSAVGPSRILDLVAWSGDNPQFSGSILQPSASGGWEPTREIANFAYGAGFQGIRFPSQHGNGGINLVLYTGVIAVTEPVFTEIPIGGTN
ncbi:MAG: RES family NAD+ phosphorylase [Gemmatimonadota bacterium]